ncbi:hypothetical protein QT972_00305 [Microcoleus sp. herbarium7]|uniref:hypothetical protein n=1 Tax=Microcoleus sp. herbarium7 TaxID=3055435 RepID=UPI002FD3BD3B
MTDPTENYQRQMQKQYATAKYRTDESETRMRREFYSVDAAAEFKRDFWPADPFEDGIFVDAAYLDVADLAKLYKARKVLIDAGHDAFAKDLIKYRCSQERTWSPIVKVNPLYVDARRQRICEIGDLLNAFYFEDCAIFAKLYQNIRAMGDPQLDEMLRQVEEALGLSERKS